MKDLDFDELDRAVNSLISKPVEASSVAAVSPVPVVESTVTDTPIVSPAPVTPAQPLAARRSSGRFMDVVHPSSDMRSASVPPPTPSREGIAVVAPTDIPTQPPTVSPELTPVTAPSVASTDMPDPLDFHQFSSESPSVPGVVATPDVSADDDKDINDIADDINKSLNETANQTPLESPFLSNTKVEKRPLGAFSTEPEPIPAVAPVIADAVEPDEVQELAEPHELNNDEDNHPIGTETPLPAELQDDLLSIESDIDTSSQTAEQQPAIPSELPIGPTSITQQYTEQPSTGDQPTGAIFDTEAYKKPIVYPKKQKSGWLFVLWIFLLLIVGAGAGAAVYFYVIPLL